jgi:hypothetical protein
LGDTGPDRWEAAMRSRYVVAGVTLLVGIGGGLSPDYAGAASPAPGQEQRAGAVSGEEIKGLVEQLGADDYTTREAAAKRLKGLGKAALPALEAAAKHDDPEVASRAQALVKRIAVRPLPAPDRRGAGAMLRRMNMRITVGENNTRVMDVAEDGRQIQIRQGPDGITVVVQGLVDGEPGSEEYTANDAAQLKEDMPEVYAIYERWAGENRPDVIFGRGGMRIMPGQILLQPPNEIDLLRGRIDKQMRDNKLKEAERDEVNKAIEKLAGARADLVGRMEKYSDQCDELRKTLEQYKLDPGELLPPPAKTRLGVSLLSEDGRMLVQQVGDESRGQRMGLKPGDVIRKVDGNEVANVGDLRKAVAAKEKGLVIEILRDGDEVKLTEKDAPAAGASAK